MKKRTTNLETSSFRDPDGFVYFISGRLYRQVNLSSKDNFDLLMSSGLYQELVEGKLLVSHREVSEKLGLTKDCYKVIKPELIPFVSYPYEWSFSQLKDAALLTLKIQRLSIERGMSLKDATGFNVQFIGCRPVFIDTLSFERYREGSPWIAYRQFCQHFLAPLALMAENDLRLNILLADFIDGIPLDLASKILPAKSKLNFSLLAHIHLHASNQKRMASKKVGKGRFNMTRFQMISFITSLESSVKNLKIGRSQTEWGRYYTFTNYSTKAFGKKQLILKSFLKKINPKLVVDLGANMGRFSRIATKLGAYTIACDIDPLAVERGYLEGRKEKNSLLLPMIIDLTSPSPSLGWANEERRSFSLRTRVDCLIALALIHHLAISNNLPFGHIAGYFSSLGTWLIVEFVPKTDSKVEVLLQNRDDIFKNYSKKDFEEEFSKYYKIVGKKSIKESKRIIYLMKKK